MIKPDLQIDDIYDISEVDELRTELKFFTEDDLQAAILQAQKEINEELYREHKVIKHKFPAKNVQLVHETGLEKMAGAGMETGSAANMAAEREADSISKTSKAMDVDVMNGGARSENEDDKT